MRSLILIIWMVMPTFSLSQSNYSSSLYFLNLVLDGRSSGMGDAGIATSPDVYSLNSNPSKYLFSKDIYGFSATYTPWMQKLVSDMKLAEVSGYILSKNQSLSGGLRYFSLGEAILIDENKENTGQSSPYQICASFAYSRKLSQYFGMSITFKYIRSDIFPRNEGYQAANAIATDLSAYLNKPIETLNNTFNLSIGGLVSNLGTKIKYKLNTNEEILPMAIKLGIGVFNESKSKNRIQFTTELHNNLLPLTVSEQPVINAFFKSIGNSNFSSSSIANSRNAGDILMGNYYYNPRRTFLGQVWQGVSRGFWENIQQNLGTGIGHLRNTFGEVCNVDFFDGATLINSKDESRRKWGMTLGSMINSKNLKASTDDPMFMHEYGHTQQGMVFGPAYTFVMGIPSLLSSSSDEVHSRHWYEKQADILNGFMG